MKVKNKWNKKEYEILSKCGNQVTLRREDGKVFTIDYSEFKFNYIEFENK